MIVANHSIGHGIKTFVPELFQQHFREFLAIQVIANPAVNVFFLMSGYFGIKPKKEKMFKLLSIVYLYAIGISIFLLIVEGWDFSLILKSMFFPWEYWWFATVYLILFLISDCINLVLKSLDNRHLNIYLIALLSINFMQGFLFNGAYWGDGFSIVQAVTMYCIGYWLNKRLANKKINSGYLFIVYFILFILLFFLTDYAEIHNMASVTKRVFSYNNPLVMAESVCLFLIFKNIFIKNVGTQKFIAFFSGAVFPIYLLTDHDGMRKYVFCTMIGNIEEFNHPVFMVTINAVTWTIVVSVIDYIRKKITFRLISKQ